MAKDLFASVPEFLAAFNNILKSGFFENITSNVNSAVCSLTAVGYVPLDKKYQEDGCGAVVDPNAIISACRKLARKRAIKNISTKVETNDWRLWDRKEENVIGSKGKRTELAIFITFKI